MSRVGKKPIIIEQGITITCDGGKISVNGPKGQLVISLPASLKTDIKDNQLTVSTKTKECADLQGLYRTLIQNAVTGVKTGWTKTLELVGVGYRAQVNGNDLVLSLGYAHPVKVPAPKGISFTVNENKVIVLGFDKYLVGEVAATVRRLKPPEPYKGKGIRYLGEYIRKKVGKAAKAVGGAGAK